jgi:hypothetical protein
VFTVGGMNFLDILGGVEEQAFDPIRFFLFEGDALLACEEGIAGPDRAPEYAGGVRAGGHGVEVLVEFGGGN